MWVKRISSISDQREGIGQHLSQRLANHPIVEFAVAPKDSIRRSGVEDVLIPTLCLRKLLLAVEMVGDQKWNVEKRFAEIG
jgi:hypothetical protein